MTNFNTLDFLEILKIIILFVVGYVIVHALLSYNAEVSSKCLCDCAENIIRLGR
jgi:hypothetical protein